MNLSERSAQAYDDNLEWFPEKADDLRHHALGLAGEAGEVANEVKKWDRGDYDADENDQVDQPQFIDAMREKIAKELADVLVYVFSIAEIIGINLDKVYDEKRAYNESRFGNDAG